MKQEARLKAKKRIELIEHTFWTCTIEAHRHQTEAVANKCIAIRKRKDACVRRKWTEDDMARFKADREAGSTYRAIGLKFGISGTRVAEIIRKWERLLVRKRLAYEHTIDRLNGADAVATLPDKLKTVQEITDAINASIKRRVAEKGRLEA